MLGAWQVNNKIPVLKPVIWPDKGKHDQGKPRVVSTSATLKADALSLGHLMIVIKLTHTSTEQNPDETASHWT